MYLIIHAHSIQGEPEKRKTNSVETVCKYCEHVWKQGTIWKKSLTNFENQIKVNINIEHWRTNFSKSFLKDETSLPCSC